MRWNPRARASEIMPARRTFLGRTIYSTSYAVSYGVVFPTMLVVRAMPKDNALFHGLADGAEAAASGSSAGTMSMRIWTNRKRKIATRKGKTPANITKNPDARPAAGAVDVARPASVDLRAERQGSGRRARENGHPGWDIDDPPGRRSIARFSGGVDSQRIIRAGQDEGAPEDHGDIASTPAAGMKGSRIAGVVDQLQCP